MEVRVCRKSGVEFSVTDDDQSFLERVSPVVAGERLLISPPTLAPELRAMRRMAWRNSNYLTRSQCALTGKPLVSGYAQDTPYQLYAVPVWWGDGWDQYASGRAFDFSRPFFEQFAELMLAAPRPALMNRDSENSDYCNYAGENKNCYMANNGSWYNENCQYGESYLHCKDSVDCNYLRKSELCYESVRSEGLYQCAFVTDCYHCADCYYSFNLRSCRDCFLCSNLRNATGYIRNRPASPEQLAECRALMRTRAGQRELHAAFTELTQSEIHPAVIHVNCEDSTGDALTNCKNVREGFIVGNTRDGKYLIHCDEGQDMWDCSLSGYGNTELYYETVSSGAGGVRAVFVSGSWTSSDVAYCDTVMSCNNCFGCSGLKRAQYCIFNKQYSRAEYERLLPRIVDHMRATGEWGEFFPERIAPHAYNDSHAMDFFPLTEAVARSYGYRWTAAAPAMSGALPRTEVPDSIDGCSEALCDTVFSCRASGKQYRLVKPEFHLLQTLGVAPPDHAPDVRRKARNTRINPPRLYRRQSDLTGAEVLSSYAPERPERICSLEEYLRLLYSAEDPTV